MNSSRRRASYYYFAPQKYWYFSYFSGVGWVGWTNTYQYIRSKYDLYEVGASFRRLLRLGLRVGPGLGRPAPSPESQPESESPDDDGTIIVLRVNRTKLVSNSKFEVMYTLWHRPIAVPVATLQNRTRAPGLQKPKVLVPPSRR